jgi:hypothetical protein
MKTLHIIGPDKGGEGPYLLVDKDNPPEGYEGTVLHDHWCSNYSFALGDLIKNGRADRVDNLKKQFGDFEVTAPWLAEPWRPS